MRWLTHIPKARRICVEPIKAVPARMKRPETSLSVAPAEFQLLPRASEFIPSSCSNCLLPDEDSDHNFLDTVWKSGNNREKPVVNGIKELLSEPSPQELLVRRVGRSFVGTR